MNPEPQSHTDTQPAGLTPRQLEEVQEFFREHHADCFWSWNPDTKMTEANAPRVLQKIRTHGGAEGRQFLLKLQNKALS